MPLGMMLDILMLADVALVMIAAVLAKIICRLPILENSQAVDLYVLAAIGVAVVAGYTMRSRGLYEAAAVIGWRTRLYDLLASIGVAFLALITAAYLLNLASFYPPAWMLAWLALVSLALAATRPLSGMLVRWLLETGIAKRRVAIVAVELTPALRLAGQLLRTPAVDICGIFQLSEQRGQYGVTTVAELIAMGQRDEFDEIFIAVSDNLRPRLAKLVRELRELPVDVWVHAADLDVPIRAIAQLGDANMLHVNAQPVRDWGYVGKLALDYAVGGVSLIVFAPLMLALAVAIRCDSPGPVLFRQRRHGYNHRLIDIYKFRTMTVAEDGDRIEQARRDDVRVTRVGKFLRRTSLDELPQLFNVLKGEMSLVGPRPHALAHNQHYRDRLERYSDRHCVKPGMTGWAQVNGYRGPTEDPDKMLRRVEMDLYYIENWSLLLDIKILALTPFLGFVHRNAV